MMSVDFCTPVTSNSPITKSHKRGALKAQITKLTAFVDDETDKEKLECEVKLEQLQKIKFKLGEIKNEYFETVEDDAELEPLETSVTELEEACEKLEVERPVAMANIKSRDPYQLVDGIRFPLSFSPACINETLNYTPKQDDVFVVTYPKCGTTWMQNIALHIFRKGKELENISEFHRRCPFIDAFGQQGIVNMPRPGAYKTHLPYTHIPYSPEAKYIYLLRNPKDCCISLYYHMKSKRGFCETNFDDFFEQFMAGEVYYNCYFDHLISWEKHRNSKQVFFTTYENMNSDPKSVILKLASFLGREYVDVIEKDNTILSKIIHFTGFEYMKKHFSNIYHLSKNPGVLEDPNGLEGLKHIIRYTQSYHPEGEKIELVRKGVIGDWKVHMSDEQSESLNKKFLERTKGSEIYDMYKEFM